MQLAYADANLENVRFRLPPYLQSRRPLPLTPRLGSRSGQHPSLTSSQASVPAPHPRLAAFDCTISTCVGNSELPPLSPCRMALTVSFNDGAHGEIHELLGGSWSRNVTAYADRTDAIVQPFVHKAVVSHVCLCLVVAADGVGAVAVYTVFAAVGSLLLSFIIYTYGADQCVLVTTPAP